MAKMIIPDFLIKIFLKFCAPGLHHVCCESCSKAVYRLDCNNTVATTSQDQIAITMTCECGHETELNSSSMKRGDDAPVEFCYGNSSVYHEALRCEKRREKRLLIPTDSILAPTKRIIRPTPIKPRVMGPFDSPFDQDGDFKFYGQVKGESPYSGVVTARDEASSPLAKRQKIEEEIEIQREHVYGDPDGLWDYPTNC